MKVSKSKQELARIISENGGWRDEAEFSAQDKDGEVFHYSAKPTIGAGREVWGHKGCIGEGEFTAEKLPNWHQTILSRAEYFHLYPAPDADGWIEWKGGECPVDEGTLIDVRYRDGHEQVGCECGVWRSELYGTHYWLNSGGKSNIIAYRLHKQEKKSISSDDVNLILVVDGEEHEIGQGVEVKEPDAKPEFCESVMRSIPEPEAKPTIEQLAADYRNAKDYAERKQQEDDDAKADADEKLRVLEIAGEAIGLVLSVAAPEPELMITDWRDLQAGDEIATNSRSKLLIVTSLRCHDDSWPIDAIDGDGITWSVSLHDWRFIRRP